MSGVLYVLGLGPGDPELITLKAARIIQSASHLAYPTIEDSESFAARIAADHIPKTAKHIPILIPMSVERAPAQKAYDTGAEAISKVLSTGQDVVLLCEGDPLFYGSAMYLIARLSDQFQIEIVPGVTSVTACAARLQTPLAAREEALSIIPATLSKEALKDKIAASNSVAIMKIGRHLSKVKDVLSELNLTNAAHYIERATLPNEVIKPMSQAPQKAPYFSMILINRGQDPWL